MNDRIDVLGIGIVTVDDLIYVEHYPPSDSKVPVKQELRVCGGLVGTALAAAARMGARSAYYGVLGDDDLSVFTERQFEQDGVDCSYILHRPGARPMHAIIVVDQGNGQRTIFHGDEYTFFPDRNLLPEDLIAASRVVLIDHSAEEMGVRIAAAARAHQIPVVADLEKEKAPDLARLMEVIDHLIIGMDFAGRMTGESEPEAMVRALALPGRACCVVTGGARGCWYSEYGGAVQHAPAMTVQSVDTTGCGDVFHGAYAASLAEGRSIAQAIRIATVAAGIKATRPGGRSGIPTRQEVLDLL